MTSTRPSRPPLHRPFTLGVLLENATDPLPGTGCRLWAGCVDSNGYGTVKLKGRTVRVPRLVMLMSYGYSADEYNSVPARLQTRHQCGDERCIEPTHLLVGMAKQNAADAKRHRAERAAANEGPTRRRRRTDTSARGRRGTASTPERQVRP